jgi:hypothetical protein
MMILITIIVIEYNTAELEKMAFLVPFSTAGNGLWEMNKWEMGFGWLLWLWGFTLGN